MLCLGCTYGSTAHLDLSAPASASARWRVWDLQTRICRVRLLCACRRHAASKHELQQACAQWAWHQTHQPIPTWCIDVCCFCLPLRHAWVHWWPNWAWDHWSAAGPVTTQWSVARSLHISIHILLTLQVLCWDLAQVRRLFLSQSGRRKYS